MKPSNNPTILLLLLPFSLLLLFLLFHLNPSTNDHTPTTSTSTAPAASTSLPPTANMSTLINIRPAFKGSSYEAYIARQLAKTLNPRLRRLWATRDWPRKVHAFSLFFSSLLRLRLLSPSSRCLCIGARLGQEVAALRSLGVTDSVGIDLVPAPPLVVRGDFHAQPFDNSSFDFEFSNVFDHALYPERFVGEIERTLRDGGVCVLHVAVHRRGDKYSANDLVGGLEAVVGLFKESEVVRVRKVDGFGLDTEVVFRKKKTQKR